MKCRRINNDRQQKYRVNVCNRIQQLEAIKNCLHRIYYSAWTIITYFLRMHTHTKNINTDLLLHSIFFKNNKDNFVFDYACERFLWKQRWRILTISHEIIQVGLGNIFLNTETYTDQCYKSISCLTFGATLIYTYSTTSLPIYSTFTDSTPQIMKHRI